MSWTLKCLLIFVLTYCSELLSSSTLCCRISASLDWYVKQELGAQVK